MAGRNLLVESEVEFSDFRVNAPDFAATRGGRAREQSHHVPRDRARPALLRQEGRGARRQRRPGDHARKAMAMGVTSIRPTTSRCRSSASTTSTSSSSGTRTRSSPLLFGGVLALGNVQQPKMLGATRRRQRRLLRHRRARQRQVYDDGGEVRDERIRTMPCRRASISAGSSPTSRSSPRSYQFRFDRYSADERTMRPTSGSRPAPSPTASVLAYEYKRGGYALGGSAFAKRASWQTWGPAKDSASPRSRTRSTAPA